MSDEARGAVEIGIGGLVLSFEICGCVGEGVMTGVVLADRHCVRGGGGWCVYGSGEESGQ